MPGDELKSVHNVRRKRQPVNGGVVKKQPVNGELAKKQKTNEVNHHQPQRFIKEEPLDIKPEVDGNQHAVIQSFQDIRPQSSLSSNRTSQILLQNRLQLPIPTNSALEQLCQIEKQGKTPRIRRTKAEMESSKKTETKPSTATVITDKKSIMCFICHDKFTSNLTFEMHLKLSHKNSKS
jgi:hypothetical protein